MVLNIFVEIKMDMNIVAISPNDYAAGKDFVKRKK